MASAVSTLSERTISQSDHMDNYSTVSLLLCWLTSLIVGLVKFYADRMQKGIGSSRLIGSNLVRSRSLEPGELDAKIVINRPLSSECFPRTFPFRRGIRNYFTSNREVKIARDGLYPSPSALSQLS